MDPPCATCESGGKMCWMVPGKARCTQCAHARRKCSLRPQSLPAKQKRKASEEAASVASESQASQKRLRLTEGEKFFCLFFRAFIDPQSELDASDIPFDADSLLATAQDALLLRTPATRFGLLRAREAIQTRLEANARELRVIVRERMVANNELAAVQDLLREMDESCPSDDLGGDTGERESEVESFE